MTSISKHEYDASSIKILDGVELAEIPYMHIAHIAKKYSKPPEIVTCAYEACMLVGLNFDDFYVNKYYKGLTIPMSNEFNEAFTECRKPTLDAQRGS